MDALVQSRRFDSLTEQLERTLGLTQTLVHTLGQRSHDVLQDVDKTIRDTVCQLDDVSLVVQIERLQTAAGSLVAIGQRQFVLGDGLERQHTVRLDELLLVERIGKNMELHQVAGILLTQFLDGADALLLIETLHGIVRRNEDREILGCLIHRVVQVGIFHDGDPLGTILAGRQVGGCRLHVIHRERIAFIRVVTGGHRADEGHQNQDCLAAHPLKHVCDCVFRFHNY